MGTGPDEASKYNEWNVIESWIEKKVWKEYFLSNKVKLKSDMYKGYLKRIIIFP